jgi:SAM-dependent methyltransferase
MAEAVAPTARFLARFPGSPDAATFERQARLEALDVYRAAAPYVHFDRPLSILDFGSGHGVLARLMAAISPLSAVRAVDFAGPEIEWCLDAYSDEIRWARMEVSVISGAPPLSFSSGCFDLVCGLTALARMGDAARLAWLAELRRITRPEGILVLGPLGDLLARHFDVLEDVPAASGSLDMVVCMRRTHPIV